MDAVLEGIKRESRGKNEARRMRVAGQIPAVLYGGTGGSSVPLSVDPKALSRILHSDSGVNTLITLRVPGEGEARVLVREYQLDPIHHRLLHADFYRVAMDKPVMVAVPIHLKGEARGVKQQGGLLDFVHREVELECLPSDIPEHLDVDVSELVIGDAVRLRDLMQDVKWTPISDPEMMIVHLVPPKAEEVPAEEEAEAAPEAAEAAEPEVIKKGKGETPES